MTENKMTPQKQAVENLAQMALLFVQSQIEIAKRAVSDEIKQSQVERSEERQ